MEWLLKNDTQQATIQLTWAEDSITFLVYMFLEHLLLPENETVKALFHTLRAKGHYKKGRWTEYSAVHHGQNPDRENKLAKFLNSLRAAAHSVCGISCL